MATVQKTSLPTGNSRTYIAKWANLAQGDDGEPVSFSQYADKTAQVSGVFGLNGVLRIEGTNDGGQHWDVLTDPQGNPLDFASQKIKLVSEAPAMVRPRIVGGDGTTALTLNLIMKE